MAIAGVAAILLPASAQPFAAAGLTCFLTIASFGWGMWQTWLICGVALLVLYLLAISDLSTENGTQDEAVKLGSRPSSETVRLLCRGSVPDADQHPRVVEAELRGSATAVTLT